jgi:NitT/TauT family transport system substrate-binding protein
MRFASPLAALALGVVTGFAHPGPAAAEEIAASQYGVAPGTYPYAIAMGLGLFAKHGVDITAIRSAAGSTPTIRELVSGGLAFADAGITGVLQARAAGADVVPIGCSVNTFSEVIWVTMPDSPVKSLDDLKGRRIGFTTARSATNMMAVILVDSAGLAQDEVEFVAAGGFPQAITAMEAGAVDVIPMVEPTFSRDGHRYKILARGNETFPPMSNTMFLTRQEIIDTRPDFLRGVIAARREAVEFMHKNPEEAARIVAQQFDQDPALITSVMVNLLNNGAVDGVEYWGLGNCNMEVINNVLEGARTVGMIDGEFDVGSIINLSFLPKDLQ